MAFEHSIANPTVFWDAQRLREVEQIDFNMGRESTPVTPINDSLKPEFYQEEPFEFNGQMTVVVTKSAPEVDFIAASRDQSEHTLTIKLGTASRFQYRLVRIGRIASSDNGRRLTVPFVALDGGYL